MKIALHASSPAELLDILRTTDISVPGRTGGRKSWHCENWSICRFLGSFANDSLLAFPLDLNGIGRSVDGREQSPDFRLGIHDRTVGIEVTEAGSQTYAWASAIAEKIPGALLEPCLFKPDVEIPRGSHAKPHVGHVNVPLVGPGWMGLEAEREWVKYVIAAVNQKTKDLGAPNFGRFDEDWLLIYDNTPGGVRNLEEAIFMLGQRLESYWQRETKFSSLLIEVAQYMIHVTSTFSRRVPLNDVCLHSE